MSDKNKSFNKDLQILSSITNHLRDNCKLDPTGRFSNYILVQYQNEVLRVTVTKEDDSDISPQCDECNETANIRFERYTGTTLCRTCFDDFFLAWTKKSKDSLWNDCVISAIDTSEKKK